MAELRLSNGQANRDGFSLLAELWAGEGHIYDSRTKTEVAVWMTRWRLVVDTKECVVRPGSRFGERPPPEPSKTISKEKTDTHYEYGAEVGGKVSATASGSADGGAKFGAKGKAAKKVQKTITSQRERQDTPPVVASADCWEFRAVGDTEAESASGRGSTYKYLDVNDRLCDLTVAANANTLAVEAKVCVFPSELEYRIGTRGSIRRTRDRITTNQDRIIKMLLMRGAEHLDDVGLVVARASLRKKAQKAE